MKKIFIFAASLALLASCSNGSKQAKESPVKANNSELSGTIQLSGAFALYPMAVKWSEEFRKLHPNVQIDISGGGAGKGMTDALSGVVDIGMVSREIYPEEFAKGAYHIPVVKDAVIPTINSANPELEAINKTGLKKETAQRLWNQEFKTWGEVLGTPSKTPIHVFTRSDACGAAETFAAWFNKKQEDLKATAVMGDPGVAAAVQKDKVGIGYNNIAYAYDQKTKKPFEGLTVIPIDVNENGVIDPEEAFYETSETLIAAINDGHYPSPPARELYLVTKGKPVKPEVVAFLKYVLTKGQQYAGETGYIGLSEEKLKQEVEKLQ
ncbi:MAG: PstS family phosphate ABC transporter substrate-binding protein [Bacteroidales bacterium]|jgi:phosphate transport system substrate-binding protein|nr:PstS family phosphate ABC transporter substrate-binding protein [Bacteroidales bacterium]